MPAIGPCAGAHVGSGARYRPGDGHAAKDHGHNVGRTLRHQFPVRAMAPPAHTVGNDR